MPDLASPFMNPAAVPSERELVMRVIPMPADANANGDIFGGWIMAQVDLAGSVLPGRITRGRIATVAVKEFLFKQPVSVGDLLSFYARVLRVGRTSVTVEVEVYAERDPQHPQVVKVTEAQLTYVAIDDEGRSRPFTVGGLRPSMRANWWLLGLGPLLATSLGMAWVVNQRAQVLSGMHLSAVEPVLLASRRAELQGKLNLGRSAIAPLVRDGRPDAETQAAALAMLRRLEFGHDGYFFVIGFDGRVLLQPRDPQLEGRNLLDLQDSQGRFTVQRLLAQARAGGGHVEIEWRRPSSGRVEPLLAYVEPIAGWEWMLATGAFMDEREQARARMEAATEKAIADTLARVAVVALLGLLAVSGLAVFLNLSEQRKADARLRRLAQQLVHSQEDERARVARELHDGIQQSLVAVKFQAESAAATQPSPQLQAVVARLREVLGELRGIAHDLRPPLLDDLGLAQALQQLGQDWSRRTGIQLRCEFDELPALLTLSDAGATTLYRFAQEALGNVERHAQAGEVLLRLQLSDEGLRLRVQDDGRGFEPERLGSGGLGLLHLRERVEMLGGRFELVSSPGAGTRLHAWLPASLFLP